VRTAGRGPAYYLPIAQQVIQLFLATFFTTEEGGHPQQPDDKENSYDSQQHVTPRVKDTSRGDITNYASYQQNVDKVIAASPYQISCSLASTNFTD
jgi:hypothetical protein